MIRGDQLILGPSYDRAYLQPTALSSVKRVKLSGKGLTKLQKERVERIFAKLRCLEQIHFDRTRFHPEIYIKLLRAIPKDNRQIKVLFTAPCDQNDKRMQEAPIGLISTLKSFTQIEFNECSDLQKDYSKKIKVVRKLDFSEENSDPIFDPPSNPLPSVFDEDPPSPSREPQTTRIRLQSFSQRVETLYQRYLNNFVVSTLSRYTLGGFRFFVFISALIVACFKRHV